MSVLPTLLFCLMDSNNLGKPGFPQKQLFSLTTSSITLWTLLIFSIFLIIQSVLRENINQTNSYFLKSIIKFKISDVSTSTALFSATLALMVINKQFQLTNRPIINFKPRSFPERPLKKGANLPEDFQYVCSIVNQGMGMCIFERIEYNVEYWSKNNNILFSSLEYDDFMDNLVKSGLRPESDFVILNMRNGSCLQSGGDYKCLEGSLRFVTSVKYLRLNIWFKSLLGEKYYKEIEVIPRKGIMALRYSSQFEKLGKELINE